MNRAAAKKLLAQTTLDEETESMTTPIESALREEPPAGAEAARVAGKEGALKNPYEQADVQGSHWDGCGKVHAACAWEAGRAAGFAEGVVALAMLSKRGAHVPPPMRAIKRGGK